MRPIAAVLAAVMCTSCYAVTGTIQTESSTERVLIDTYEVSVPAPGAGYREVHAHAADDALTVRLVDVSQCQLQTYEQVRDDTTVERSLPESWKWLAILGGGATAGAGYFGVQSGAAAGDARGVDVGSSEVEEQRDRAAQYRGYAWTTGAVALLSFGSLAVDGIAARDRQQSTVARDEMVGSTLVHCGSNPAGVGFVTLSSGGTTVSVPAGARGEARIRWDSADIAQLPFETTVSVGCEGGCEVVQTSVPPTAAATWLAASSDVQSMAAWLQNPPEGVDTRPVASAFERLSREYCEDAIAEAEALSSTGDHQAALAALDTCVALRDDEEYMAAWHDAAMAIRLVELEEALESAQLAEEDGDYEAAHRLASACANVSWDRERTCTRLLEDVERDWGPLLFAEAEDARLALEFEIALENYRRCATMDWRGAEDCAVSAVLLESGLSQLQPVLVSDVALREVAAGYELILELQSDEGRATGAPGTLEWGIELWFDSYRAGTHRFDEWGLERSDFYPNGENTLWPRFTQVISYDEWSRYCSSGDSWRCYDDHSRDLYIYVRFTPLGASQPLYGRARIWLN